MNRWRIQEIGERGTRQRWFCTDKNRMCYERATHYLILRPGPGSIGPGRESRMRRCEKHAREFAARVGIVFPEKNRSPGRRVRPQGGSQAMMHLLCQHCLTAYLPKGRRQVLATGQHGEPAEMQRLTVGIARAPQPSQRYVEIAPRGSDGQPTQVERIALDLSHYDCDECNAPIRPGDRCAAHTVWLAWRPEPAPWEQEYLDALSVPTDSKQ